MVLLTKHHLLCWAICRRPFLDEIRAWLGSQRRRTRPKKTSLVDRLVVVSSVSGNDGSDGIVRSVEE